MQIAVPTSIQNLEPELRRFVEAMVVKLRMNRHKGKWEGLDLRTILGLLRAEVDELNAAIESGNQVEMLLEAADVANFAMIAAAIAINGETDGPGPGPRSPGTFAVRARPRPGYVRDGETGEEIPDPYESRFDPPSVEPDMDRKSRHG